MEERGGKAAYHAATHHALCPCGLHRSHLLLGKGRRCYGRIPRLTPRACRAVTRLSLHLCHACCHLGRRLRSLGSAHVAWVGVVPSSVVHPAHAAHPTHGAHGAHAAHST